MIRTELERLEAVLSTETANASETQMNLRSDRAMPVMDVVDRLRLNLFKIERLQSKLHLALSEVAHIVAKK